MLLVATRDINNVVAGSEAVADRAIEWTVAVGIGMWASACGHGRPSVRPLVPMPAKNDVSPLVRSLARSARSLIIFIRHFSDPYRPEEATAKLRYMS